MLRHAKRHHDCILSPPKDALTLGVSKDDAHNSPRSSASPQPAMHNMLYLLGHLIFWQGCQDCDPAARLRCCQLQVTGPHPAMKLNRLSIEPIPFLSCAPLQASLDVNVQQQC